MLKMVNRMSSPDVFSQKSVLLQICCIFTEEYPYRSVISVELNSHFFMDDFFITASLYMEVNTADTSRHSLANIEKLEQGVK